MERTKASSWRAISAHATFGSFETDWTAQRGSPWGYIDARRDAQAVCRALEVSFADVEVFIVASADTVVTTPNAQLLAGWFSGVPLTRKVGPHETPLSIHKARRVLGFEPQLSWRQPIQAWRRSVAQMPRDHPLYGPVAGFNPVRFS